MHRRVSTEAHTKYAPGKHNEQKLTLYTHKAQFDTVVHRIREQKTKAASHLMHALCDIYLFSGKTKPPLSQLDNVPRTIYLCYDSCDAKHSALHVGCCLTKICYALIMCVCMIIHYVCSEVGLWLLYS